MAITQGISSRSFSPNGQTDETDAYTLPDGVPITIVNDQQAQVRTEGDLTAREKAAGRVVGDKGAGKLTVRRSSN